MAESDIEFLSLEGATSVVWHFGFPAQWEAPAVRTKETPACALQAFYNYAIILITSLS